MNATYREATALDVTEGDIVIKAGCRCRATNVRQFDPTAGVLHPASNNGPVARYTLTSEPNAEWPNRLPGGYDGGTYGGNKNMGVLIEVR